MISSDYTSLAAALLGWALICVCAFHRVPGVEGAPVARIVLLVTVAGLVAVSGRFMYKAGQVDKG